MKDIRDFEPLWGVWRIDQPLGSGSFGTVWRASRTEFGQTYLAAIKHISIPRSESELTGLEKHKLIHRDIMPQNIFVNNTGDYKLGDFGTARQLERTSSVLSKKGHV